MTKKRITISVVIISRDRRGDAARSISSMLDQSYKPKEIILVDNGSSDNTAEYIEKKFPRVRVIRSKINLGAAGGRNLGLGHTTGELILFMDDDAIADSRMVAELVAVIKLKQQIGVVQPKIYERERRDYIQGIGHGINLLTGRVFGIGVHQKDLGQYENILDIPMVGCTWMVRRLVFDRVGLYDEDFFIPYEDSDFSQRVTKAGFRILYVPRARVWHRGPKKTFVDQRLEWIGITSPERAYRVSRNKIMFMRKHAPPVNLVFFILVLVPFYTLAHAAIMVKSGRLDILKRYLLGLLDGLRYVVIYRPAR